MNSTDYKTLKKNYNDSKGSKLNARSSSISMVRIDREFSPMKRKGSTEAALGAEKLISELTDNDHENVEEIREQLENESLPGTCKS